jgi:tetratricopeptide (TPR) repeat protein
MVDSTAAFERGVYDIGGRTPAPDNAALVPALMNLAGERLTDGRLEDAEALITRALSLSDATPADNDPDFVSLLNDLIRSSLKQSAHTIAEPLLLRLLAIKRTKGEDHPEVATVLASLASVRKALGRHESAEQLWRRVLEIRERTLAPNHFALATALEHLGEACAARGKIGEAVALLQRAHIVRELTLGVDHSSLRVSRDRIADLQLQASEESPDSSAAESTASAPERYRLLPSAHTVADAPPPARARSAAKPWKEIAPIKEIAPVKEVAPVKKEIAPVKEVALAEEIVPVKAMAPIMAIAPVVDVEPSIEEEISELSTALAVTELPATNGESRELAPAPYLDALLNIQRELEDDYQEEAQKSRAADIFASVVGAVRGRQKESLIAAGAVVLLVGFAAVSYAWSGRVRPGATEQSSSPSATSSLPVGLASTASNGPVILANAPAKPVATASAASIPVATRTRDADERTPAKKKGNSEPIAISIPKVPSSVAAGFDGVVKTRSVSDLGIGESLVVPAGPVTGEAQRVSFQSDDQGSAPAQSARLIGALPTPPLPNHLRDVQGEVRVRFNVDAAGQPVMSSLSVVNTSDVLLTAAVLKVIPGLRFEPARTGGPDPKLIADVVELRYQFAKSGRAGNK